jgi:hypothetical protein
MTRLHAVELTLVAVWLGAAILLAAAVAPAAFRVLPSRTLAGALVGQVLPVIFASGLFIAIIALGLEARATRYTLRFAVYAPFVLMIVACVVAQFLIGPKIDAVRAVTGGAVEALDATDPRRVQFGRLHGFSVLCMGVAMLGATWAIVRKLFTLSP